MKGSYLLTLMLVSLVAGCQPAAQKPTTISSTKKPTNPPATASQTTASGEAEKKTDDETQPGSDANPSADNSAPAEPDPPANSQASQPTDTAPANLGTRQEGTDWTTFLGPGANSKSTETGILKQWPAAGLRIVWQKKLGTSYGIGSVANGRYYQFDRTDETIHLDCLHSETGKSLWTFKYPSDYEDLFGYDGGPRASPLVDGNRVYLFGVEGLLHCLNAETGTLIWKFDTVREFGVVQNFFGAGSTPVIEGDLLIAFVGGSPAESQTLAPGDLSQVTGNGTGIVAFNKYTGKVHYKISDELASYASPVLTTIGNRRWCFAFARSGLLGFDPLLGKIDFHYPWRARNLESVNASTPVIVGNEVFISETYGPGSSLLRVQPGKADVVWHDDPQKREKAMLAHWNTPIHHDGYLYGCSGRHTENADVRCIEWKTGKVMWSIPRTTRVSLMYVDGHFIWLGEFGDLLMFKANPKKFEPTAGHVYLAEPGENTPAGITPPQLLKYPCWAAPILSHGLMYVRGSDRVLCLELIPSKS